MYTVLLYGVIPERAGTRSTRLQRTNIEEKSSSQPERDSNAEGSGDHPRSNRVLVDSKTFLRCLSDIPKGQALASRAWMDFLPSVPVAAQLLLPLQQETVGVMN